MTTAEIEVELSAYLPSGAVVPASIYEKLSEFLNLLLKWNAKTNLTAIREPLEIVRRHFGESLFAAQHLGICESLLDFGSGAGFPGLPIQLFFPTLRVTLAESQNKKATFLREVIRSLGLPTEVWAGRVEAMPPSQRFDVVTLRAVDKMDAAVAEAAPRARKQIILLTTDNHCLILPNGFIIDSTVPLPAGEGQQLLILKSSAQ